MKTVREHYDALNKVEESVINDIKEFMRYMKPGEKIDFDQDQYCSPDLHYGEIITGLSINDDGDVVVDIECSDSWELSGPDFTVTDLINIYDNLLITKQ